MIAGEKMRKATKIVYNPFENFIDIKIATNSSNPVWEKLADNSDLLKYTGENMKVLFTNIAEDVVSVVNEKQNSSDEGLVIYFYGPEADYNTLKQIVTRANNEQHEKKPLTCEHLGKFNSADDSLQIVKDAYSRIADEFVDYLPGSINYTDDNSIGNSITVFNEIISKEIPICILGNYSVGKSAFINALIGDEILPSKVNASTAKNVKVIRSLNGQYSIEMTYRSDEYNEESCFKYEVICGGLKIISADGSEADIALELQNELITAIGNKKVYPNDLEKRSKAEIVHDILDTLNNLDNVGLLKNIQWNLIITVPFIDSVLTKTDSTVAFFDTPGSNNSSLKQADHRKALEELLKAQTNALPILLTTKDNAASNDVSDIRNLLDEYSDNFSAPNCLVVIAKSDLLFGGQFQEPVPILLTTWHGKSTVLFATQVGAIGLRKKDENWIDDVYKEAYKSWMHKYNNDSNTFKLPKYNKVPCRGRSIIDAEANSSSAMFATGIPSIECEILYYIDHYANYKKAIRGRDCLLEALDCIQQKLQEKKSMLNKATKDAKKKKEEEKARLIGELDQIIVPDLTQSADSIAKTFEDRLNEYCKELPEIVNEVFDKINKDNPLNLNHLFNVELKKHCQKYLIDECYDGENGIQKEINKSIRIYADKYIKALSQFVTSNSKVLSAESKESINYYINNEVRPPEFEDIKSILDDFDEFMEMTSLVEYGFLSLTKDQIVAKEKWLEGKRKSFEKKLREGTSILSHKTDGLFKRAAISNPLSEYNEQFKAWAENYNEQLKKRIESENAVLSGMEDSIQKLNSSVDDIVTRVNNVTDAKDVLLRMTDQIDL